ncbi:Vacuolar protein sorting-associated protein 33B [Clonorchis sinensis]|uniref:Vacuolar protein sorting-associated protein 33B n=1 Tax=Clonorchis sinensis TaxID=79923 RepID=A0A8T1MWG8_CLOSI|nr:Vacuolar protein sorting-associated protein 33B [Clonorchis sinensis]
MAFSLDALQQVRWKNMAKVFALVPGEKVLLVDATILHAVDRVITMPVLRRLGVNKIFKLADMPPKADVPRLAYLLPPTHSSVEIITKHCGVDEENDIQRTRLIIFVPQETEDMRYLLESRGLYGQHICTASLSLSWIPIDSDLITLNLPVLFADYYLHGDYTWPQFMGLELGELLEVACDSELAPMGELVHAFGEAAEAVVSGVRLYCIRSGLVQGVVSKKSEKSRSCKSTDRLSDLSSQSSACSSSIDAPLASASQLRPPPLVVIFSRNLDYVTPMLVPMTFEALIHEIIGIDLGMVELSDSACSDKSMRKQLLNGEMLQYYKAVRDIHISCVFKKLEEWGTKLQDTRSGLEFEMATRLPTNNFDCNASPTSSITSHTSNTSLSDLKYFGAQVAPLMAKRRELSFLLIVLEQIMDRLTRRERVEDVRAAQTLLLRSGSGGTLAMTSGKVPSESNGGVSPSGDTKSATPAAGGACGTLADETTSMPIRLAVEWLSTYHGDRLLDGLRLSALASVTHDGLGEEVYNLVHRAVLHAAGQAAFPLLFALRCLRVLAPVKSEEVSEPTNLSNRNLSTAVARLGISSRRKSQYSRLHHLLRLSHSGQANRNVEQAPVSPSYVYAGQHCPVVVRLVESIWATSVLQSPLASCKSSSDQQQHSGKATASNTDMELIGKNNLVSALKLMGMSNEASTNLGMVSFADPLLAVAGYQSEILKSARRPLAPLAQPLPLLSANQPVVVVFPGGCTYGEVAALRFAAARRRWQLLIVTSCLITSRELLQQAGQAVVMKPNTGQ